MLFNRHFMILRFYYCIILANKLSTYIYIYIYSHLVHISFDICFYIMFLMCTKNIWVLIPNVYHIFVECSHVIVWLLRILSYVSAVEKERDEIEIGFPTDVKHVAHIGWEGSSGSAPGWVSSLVPFRPICENSSF